MKKIARGFTLIELLGALAVGSVMIAGLAVMVDTSLEDTKSQQAAFHQSQVSVAAGKYINANYATLSAGSGAAPMPLSVTNLKDAHFLSANFNEQNAYGQTPCVLVLKNPAGKLDALIVTQGSEVIPRKDIAYVAANAGVGGGYIPYEDAATARGAYGAWSLALAAYSTPSCSAATAGAGHLATALFFDGSGPQTADYLYRKAVPGHPELNQMETPLNMRKVVTENSSDTLCIVGDTSTQGRIAVNAAGAVLSCQAGVWKRQGAAYWKDPVASFAALAALPTTGLDANNIGDVRMTNDSARAYSWDGAAWKALAVDKDGNMNIPARLTAADAQLTRVVSAGTPCAPDPNPSPPASLDGMLAVDATGMLISCQSGLWRKFAESEITAQVWNFANHQTPDTGDYDLWQDLTTLPGSRPLFASGDNACKSFDDNESFAYADFRDSAGVFLGFVGGCKSLSNIPVHRVMSGNYIGLQKVPENAKWIHICMHSFGHPKNYSDLTLNVFNSR